MKPAYTFKKSNELWVEANKYIPGGSQGTRQPEYPEHPIYFDRAKGCRMWDVDGNEFIDFLCSIGPIILGYSYDSVNEAVCDIVKTSFQSSMNHPIMIEVAKIITEMVPSADGVRFMKTGTEATQLAVRLARHITGRMYIARHGYHGWADLFMGHLSLPGVDKDASDKVLPFDGTAEGLDKFLKESPHEFAAVMICPADVKPFTHENYQGIIDAAHAHGALVIFDEIKSGFRIAPGGAQEYLNVLPDITTLSKGIANGYPLSAIVGREAVIKELPSAGIAGTFSVEGLSLAASLATLKEIKNNNVVPHLYKMGQRLIDGLNDIFQKYGMHEARAYGDPVPSMPRLQWREGTIANGVQLIKDEDFHFFFSELLKHGVYLSSWHVAFMNFSHQEKDVDEALEICDYVMGLTKQKCK
jgi:glutamate-1-semialdehyde aminotransferase